MRNKRIYKNRDIDRVTLNMIVKSKKFQLYKIILKMKYKKQLV